MPAVRPDSGIIFSLVDAANKISPKSEMESLKNTIPNVVNDDEELKKGIPDPTLMRNVKLDNCATELIAELPTKNSKTIGMVLTRNSNQVSAENFYNAMTAGIAKTLAEHGYSLVLHITNKHHIGLEVYYDWASKAHVDGLVITDLVADDPRIAQLSKLELPVVVVGEGSKIFPDMVQVGISGVAEAELIVTYLAQLGHREICYIAGSPHFIHETERIKALRTAGKNWNVKLRVIYTDYSVEGGLQAAETALKKYSKITAVVASTEYIALGALRWAKKTNIKIPEKLSLVSWEDSLAGQMVSPSVTALDRKIQQVGERIAQSLLRLCAGQEVNSQITSGSILNIRQSSAIARNS